MSQKKLVQLHIQEPLYSELTEAAKTENRTVKNYVETLIIKKLENEHRQPKEV